MNMELRHETQNLWGKGPPMAQGPCESWHSEVWETLCFKSLVSIWCSCSGNDNNTFQEVEQNIGPWTIWQVGEPGNVDSHEKLILYLELFPKPSSLNRKLPQTTQIKQDQKMKVFNIWIGRWEHSRKNGKKYRQISSEEKKYFKSLGM